MDALITAEELAAALESDQADRPGWVVFDCRFDLSDPRAGRQAYAGGHIPGARYANLDDDLSAPPRPQDGRHPLPEREQLRVWLGKAGVGAGTRVVAYDDSGGAFAARLWWLLKWLGHDQIAVLSGGLAAWRAASLPLSDAIPNVQGLAAYPDNGVNPSWVISADALAGEMAAGKRLVDVRAPERYSGAKEPLDPVAGHIPGATNYPFQRNLDAAGLFLAPETMRAQLLDFLGGQTADGIIAMCGSGVTACHLLLAMDAAGLPGARLYAGSWSEWIRDPNRPVARGADSGGTGAN